MQCNGLLAQIQVFHETRYGLYRGVIRDVLPEETSVPVIAERMRGQTKEVFAQECGAAVVSESTTATILEVPRGSPCLTVTNVQSSKNGQRRSNRSAKARQ